MSTNLFAFVKSKVSIVDVASSYTTLKKLGNYLKGSCPFHNEKTASFTVTPHKEIFYCFGCQMGGDVISFIEKIENISPIEAIKHLSQKYNFALPEYNGHKETVTVSEKEQYYLLCSTIALWCHKQLLSSPEALAYTKKRGLSEETVKQFLIGYFPSGLTAIRSLGQFLKEKNILLQDVVAAKIIAPNTRGNGFYSSFEERIIFPIKDHLGNFCAFGGRVFRENDDRPKYYNSHDHIYFSKSELVFGLDNARKKAQTTNTLFLMEGYFDVVIASQYGYAHSVATLGTSFSADHLKLLSRYAEKMYIMYDGDSAGQKATLKLTELCWNANRDLFVIRLPHDEDPASFLVGGKNFDILIEQAQDIFLFFIQELTKDFFSKTLQERLSLLKKLLEGVSRLEDPLKKDLLLQKASASSGISQATLKDYLTKIQSKNIEKTVGQTLPEKTVRSYEASQFSLLEKRLFCVILHKDIPISYEEKKELRDALPLCLQEISIKIEEKCSFSALTEAERALTSKILVEAEIDTLSHDPQEYERVLVYFRKKMWTQQVQKLKAELSQAQQNGDNTIIKKLLVQFELLKKKTIT